MSHLGSLEVFSFLVLADWDVTQKIMTQINDISFVT
jgi:hypothetical protein